MSPNLEYQRVCAYLKALHIHFCEKWVFDNINSLRSVNPTLSTNDIEKAIYNKWLTVNLRDLKVGSLPPNVSSYEKFTINGTFAVQVESMIDSARSCYSELQRIENPSKCEYLPDKSDEDSKSKRCLTFLLCDGIQEVQAMEYQFIRTIKLNDPNLLPGFKIIVKGPIVCRKGMLLLQEENVKVYGGKIDILCETNHLLKLLRVRLGLNTNNCENQQIGAPCPASEDVQPREIIQQSSKENNISDETKEIDELLSQNDDILLNLTFEPGFEDECNQIHLKQNVQIEQNCLQVTQKSRKNSWDRIALQNNKLPLGNKSVNNCGQGPSVAHSVASTINKKEMLENQSLNPGSIADNRIDEISPVKSSFTDDITENDIFESQSVPTILSETRSVTLGKCTQMKMSSYLTSFKKEHTSVLPTERCSLSFTRKQAPKTVMTYPFVYLKQIKDMELIKPTKFTVKAIILTLKSKIVIKKDEFALKACISDGSSTILANFSSQTLEIILEYSPCEVASMLSEKTRNSAVGEKLKEIFFSAQQKLLSMNCLMEIQFFNDCTTPMVVGLEEIQLQHVNALKEIVKELFPCIKGNHNPNVMGETNLFISKISRVKISSFCFL